VEIICLAKEVGKLMPRKLMVIENNFQENLEKQMDDLERETDDQEILEEQMDDLETETDDQEIFEEQMDDLERETDSRKRQFQASLQEQVKSAADACQVSAEWVKELSKVGASMLPGDNPAPTEMTEEVLVSNNDSIWLLKVSRNIFAGYECK
jgi:hypothetical protein